MKDAGGNNMLGDSQAPGNGALPRGAGAVKKDLVEGNVCEGSFPLSHPAWTDGGPTPISGGHGGGKD